MFDQPNKILGMLFIVLGLIAFFVALFPILLPLILLLAGLWLINLGLRLYGKPPLIILISQIWATRSFKF